MSFFDPPPPPPEPEPQRQPWRGDSTDTVGGAADLVPLVVRNERAAVLISGVVAYPSGFSLHVVTITRLFERMNPRSLGRGRAEPEEALRFGIRFADGSKVTNVDSMYRPGPPPALGRSLQQRGGGGGGRKYSFGYWCQPLPPPGPMAFVCEWPQYDIAVTEVESDAGAILSAAERAYPIWPDDVGLPGPPAPGAPHGSALRTFQAGGAAT